MPLKQSSSPLAPPSASSSRQFAHQARSTKESSASPKRTSDSPSAEEPPAKIHKADTSYRKPGVSANMHSERTHPRSGRGAGSSLLARAHKNNVSGGGRGGKKKQKDNRAPPLPGPFHDEQYITNTYRTKPLKKIHETNPKSPLNNFIMASGGQMEFTAVHGLVEGSDQPIWRSTIVVKHDDGDIAGVGDHPVRKLAENLAALSALYQLDAIGAFEKRKEKGEVGPIETALSDGTLVSYERARHFMDYYCRRFRFAKPDIVYAQPTRGPWQADMIVGERRIGFGKGPTKKEAMTRCYTDVVQYLEKCDPSIWKDFVRDVKSGKDLGMAPTVLFQADELLEDKIQNLKDDIKRSTLYRNRPTIRSTADGEVQQAQGGSAYRRPPASSAFLAEKSERLRSCREAYLANPELASIRNTRASLPVFTKSAELLQHINNNDVTICMAATGSGKTTQIPQLILDEYIDRGEGAKCNIVCTQPRRIAAISVAERVSKERGETCGRGSVGYQVRFESKLPEDHGSITYCTTGVFLRKMQTALMETSSRRSMDDVTHIVVDEVHERDVDIDLMLVVLKRLLAERRAQKKPIKIVLMSATIDATLFKNYFPDEQGQPAGVVEIPGRAYAVQKHFLDDFVPELSSDPKTSWVFREESVRKYLTQELGPDAPGVGPSLSSSRAPTPILRDNSRDTDDLELPVPLVALTVAHVLKKSEDGHVLVFLPGWDDISAVRRCLTDAEKSRSFGFNFADTSKFSIHLLHSTIPVAEQQAIFDPPPPGVRRIILSTNIAETSVTIPDVVYVVDTARIKEQRYDPSRHISNLVSAWVGSSNLNQRAGRAGRHRPGEYFGILSRKHSEELHPHQTVEMKRVDLENVVMHVKALNFPRMTIEEVLAATIEPPAPERIDAAIQSLHMVGALDMNNNLTSLGSVLLQLPVDPRLGRLVLFGSFFRCLDAALTLAAIMGSREPFVAPIHVKAEAQARKNSWTPEEFRSDILAALRAYREWWSLQSQGLFISANRFCQDNFLSKPTLLNIAKVKDHLLKALYDVGVIDISAGGKLPYVPPGMRSREIPPIPQQLNENGESLPLLAALIAIACQPKFAIRTGERTYRTAVDKVVIIHPSSVNHRKREMPKDAADHPHIEKQIVAYAEKRQNISTSQSAEKYLVATTRLDPLTFILFGAYRISVTQRGLECDEWLPVIGRMDVLDDLERLKVMMEDCILRVFQGIIASRQRKAHMNRKPLTYDEGREDESGDEEDDLTNVPLTDTEIKELDLMTVDLVRILNHYSTYRVAMQSQTNSRPGTPMDSPSLASVRLPSYNPYSCSRSGYSTPYNIASAYSSRPSTPSRLSRQ